MVTKKISIEIFIRTTPMICTLFIHKWSMWLSLPCESSDWKIDTWYDVLWQRVSFSCLPCYLIVNTVSFLLVLEFYHNRFLHFLCPHHSPLHHIPYMIEKYLTIFSLSMVFFVWISYMLHKIIVTEWTNQHPNMLLEYLLIFFTQSWQCSRGQRNHSLFHVYHSIVVG